MVIVEDRTKETLYDLIQKFIHPDTIVFTDGWRSYRNMAEELGFAGWAWVNHSTNFVSEEPFWVQSALINPELIWTDYTGQDMPPGPNMVPVKVHTNTCERMWEDTKSYVLSCHSKDQLDYYLGNGAA